MGTKFKKGDGNWTKYRGPDVVEIDFHRSDDNIPPEDRRSEASYHEKMAQVCDDTIAALKHAYDQGKRRFCSIMVGLPAGRERPRHGRRSVDYPS
jgi:hypothetical protein